MSPVVQSMQKALWRNGAKGERSSSVCIIGDQ
jgi:hypothetical protein